jgi:hypothetical protein
MTVSDLETSRVHREFVGLDELPPVQDPSSVSLAIRIDTERRR